MPPISLEELKKLKRLQKNGKSLYQNEEFDAFCTLMGKVATTWSTTYKRQFQNKLQEFSDALYAVKRDPNDPEFQYSIEDSLDVLDGWGRFLFQKAPRGKHNDPDDEELNNYNLISNIIKAEGTDAQLKLFEKSCKMLNETLKLGFDTEALEDNEINDNAYADRERERQERIKQRPLDREREERERRQRRQREAAERKERREREQKREEQDRLQAERRFKLVQNYQKAQEEQERHFEEKKIEAQRYREELKRREAEQERKEQEELKRKQKIQEEERNKTAEQKRQEEEQQKQEQNKLRKEIQEKLERSERLYRSDKTSRKDRKNCLACAAAAREELNNAKLKQNWQFSDERVEKRTAELTNSAGIKVAEFYGKLDNLAHRDPDEVLAYLSDHEKNARDYPAAARGDTERAGKILEQMSRTSRIMGNSREYEQLRKAMQRYSTAAGKPGPADQYLASMVADKYLSADFKLTKPRKTAVGKTRLACCLAFKKQTMDAKDFKAWCKRYNLDSREIGLAGEAHQAAMKGFPEEQNVTERDFARLTALSAISAKGEDTVIEQEKLEEQIQKIRKDPNFRKAMEGLKNDKGRRDLCARARSGELDELDSYAKPEQTRQKRRIEMVAE